jgi:hypothetical protein
MILQLKIEDVIAQVNDGKRSLRDLLKLSLIVVHRCGKDLKFGIDLGDTAPEICAHYTGKDDKYPEVAKATGHEIAYTFMVGGDLGDPAFDGVIWQCLSLDDVGRHAKKWNTPAIGVSVIADPRVRPCSSKQMQSLIDLLTILSMVIKGEPSSCIKGHMELPGSSSDPNKLCPGPLLPMDVMREDVTAARGELGLQMALMSGLVL